MQSEYTTTCLKYFLDCFSFLLNIVLLDCNKIYCVWRGTFSHENIFVTSATNQRIQSLLIGNVTYITL